MKNILYILIFIPTLVFSQNEIKADKDAIKANKDSIEANKGYITYQKKLHKIKYGENVILKIKNVNPFISKSFTEYNPINFDFSTTEFIKNAPKLDNEQEEAPKLINDDRTIELVRAYKARNEYLYELENFNEQFNLTEDPVYLDKIEDLKKKILEQESKIVKLESELNDLTKKNKELQKELDELKEIKKLESNFVKDFKKFQNSFNKITNYSLLNTLLIAQIKETPVFISSDKTFKAKAESTLISLTKKKVVDFTKKDIVNQFDELISLNNRLSINYQKINELLKKRKFEFTGKLKDGDNILNVSKMEAELEIKYTFEDEMSKVKAIHDSLINPKNKNKIITETFKGCDLYSEIQGSDFTTTISSDFVYDDSAEIIFKLKDAKDNVLHTYPKIKVRTYGNWKVNASAGYFLNFIGDDNYETYRNEKDTITNYLRASNKNDIKHSLGGLIHAYYNLGTNLALGFSAGLSINDDSNAGFYLGGSTFITEHNRLVLTCGVSFIKVNKLNTSNLYKTDDNIYYFKEDNYQIKYDKVYRPSLFIGITYNLFK
jgi:hypothetical protein